MTASTLKIPIQKRNDMSNPIPQPMILSPQQIYEIARGVGFPQKVAITMTAIALRESGGNPAVHNEGPVDDSYGLWQINLLSAQVKADVLEFMPNGPDDLKNPENNAKAAFKLYGGKLANLRIAWAFDKLNPDKTPSEYKIRYEIHLPVAQTAALLSGI